MTRLRWRKILRDLRLHPSRTALVVLAMVVGLAGAGAVLDTWALMRQVTREEYRASHPASATLRVDSVNAALVAQLQARPDLSAVQARRSVSGTVKRQGDVTSHAVVLYSLADFRSGRIGSIVSQSGDWPPTDGSLVLEHSSLEYGGLASGDTIVVQLPNHDAHTLTVRGVARDVGLPPGWMEHVVYSFASPQTMAQLGASATFNEIQLIVRDSTLDRDGVRRVAYDVKRAIESQGHAVSNVDVPVPGEHQHAAQINSLLYTQGAFGVLALVLSGVLVVNLIAAMLAGQVREIGIMKAIGASPSQVASMYLAMAFLLGVVACAIALPLAAIVGRAYANFTADLLNFSTIGFSIPWSAFAMQLAVGLTLPVAAASIPVVRGCRISVADALRDLGISSASTTASASSSFAHALTRTGLSRPMLLSLRNAFRKRQRMLLTLLTLSMGGAVFMGAGNLKTAVRGAVGLIFETQRYDLALRLDRAWPVDSIERLIAPIGGVESVEAWSAARAALDHHDGTLGNAFPVSGVPFRTTLLEHRLVEGQWLSSPGTRELIVNRRVAIDEPAFRVGAHVTLLMSGQPQDYTVVGIIESGPSPIAYASREFVSTEAGGAIADRLVVRSTLRGEPSQIELMQRVRTALASARVTVQSGQLMSESHAVMEDHLLMVAGFLGIMGRLMIVVGGLALASTMGMAVLERTREIGVMRAIGAPHRSILVMVQTEGLVIALLSWLLAIPLSLPMSIALGNAFGRIMIPVATRYTPEWIGVAQWLAVAVIVSLVACAAPAWRATRITTKAALAYE